jgi:hypothetical protein
MTTVVRPSFHRFPSLKLALSAVLLAATPALAQQLELPRPSPTAKVSQVVGLTEIAVEYSSPAVKGRKVFGTVVPFGQLWRTGANAATKLTFSKDALVGDKPVPAGTYALFTIPGADSFTVILNKNPNQGGTGQYKADLDVLRIQVKPQPLVGVRERLTFLFANTTESTTSLDLEWEKLRLAIPIKTNTDAQVQTAIKALEDNAWRPYTSAARYLLESKSNLDWAQQLVDKSLAIREDWLNVWTKGQLLAAKSNPAEACKLALRAKTLGDKNPDGFFYADDVKKALSDWKCAAK